MSTIIEALDELAGCSWQKEWQKPAFKQFVLSGDTGLLKFLPKFKGHSWLPPELLEVMPSPNEMDLTGQRLLQACLAAELPQALGSWLNDNLSDEDAQRVEFSKACEIAKAAGYSEFLLAVQLVLGVRPFRDSKDASPTPLGQFLLSLTDKMLGELVAEVCRHENHARDLSALYVANAPGRWKTLLEKLNKPDDISKLFPQVWTLPLEADPQSFLEPTARAFELTKRFDLGEALCKVNPQKFHTPMEKLCVDRLFGPDPATQKRLWRQAEQAASWLVVNSPQTAGSHLTSYFAAPLDTEAVIQSDFKNRVLDLAVQTLKQEAVPWLEACFATPQPEVQLQALKLWIPLATETGVNNVAAHFKPLLNSDATVHITRAVRLAGDWNPAALENDLWPLLSHKSRPVRDAAASVLAKLGDSRLPKAKELWAARRADARIAAAAWLQSIGTPVAAAELKSRLEVEEADDVRDVILLALEKISGNATTSDPAELKARIAKTVAKMKGLPAETLNLEQLPPAKLKDGSPLPNDWLLYLLYRQSRVKEMRADIEARPVIAMLDRHTTGDLALAVVQTFFVSKADADDRWAMAFAALIGNDRLVPLLTRHIKEWADNMRGKLAEYAVQALALLGTDAALLAVDAMAIRYRSKNKNIGKAATEAFAAAAAARGLTVEELGDLVVPWLGFKPGEARIVETGKAKIEVRINNEFKLVYRDTATNKKVAKLPDSVSAETKEEFKELSAGLKESVKSQLLRMETLMVRQFRWPVARWQELYLRHPLLLPFAQRLVWGTYDEDGKLTATFRALEDQSLTDAADEPFTLPTQCQVGIVHPLELDAEACQAWLKHLADYDIVPPFAQLERPVVTVKSDQQQLKFGLELEDTELNGLTFKGRAERLGWARGSVCDAGSISFYLKSFPAAGVDVFVATEGMFVGIDMYTDITLGKIFFARHGSVKIGGYEYDEPNDERDHRLVPFGEVPAIAFSEAMGDLARIAGMDKNTTEENTE